MAVFLSQWLCPARHCLIALVWDEGADNAQDIEARGERAFQAGYIRRFCGICASQEIRPEHARTRFSTVEEALPHFQQVEAENDAARRLLGDSSVDPKQVKRRLAREILD